jgi:hypothetical protein
VTPIILYLGWELVGSKHDNPWARLLFVSNRLADAPDGTPQYAKSYWVSALGGLSTWPLLILNYLMILRTWLLSPIILSSFPLFDNPSSCTFYNHSLVIIEFEKVNLTGSGSKVMRSSISPYLGHSAL